MTTAMNNLPEGWKKYRLEELLDFEQPTPYIVELNDYDDSYPIPVLTAGKSFIVGKTNETSGIYNKLPVIIFDDFTTASQFVDFPFKVKSSAMKILTAKQDLILTKFAYYRMQIIKFDTSTHKRYWIQQYSKQSIAIPPIDEQLRIVAKIEELFSKLDAGVESLKKAKQQLSVYRQAVLKEAFEGCGEKKRLSEISTVISGFAFKSNKYNPNGKFTVVKIGNVKQWRLDFSKDLTKTDEADEKIIGRYLLKYGDCLISLTGSRGKRDYGFVAMIENESDYFVNQRVAALRFNFDFAVPKFYKYYLASPGFRNEFFKYETGNVGQGNVGIKALQEPFVVCPTLTEQAVIVRKIESSFSVCDKIEQTIDKSLKDAETLRQSILKKAFEGGL